MDLLVQDTRIATDQVTSLAASQGGYILSSNIWYKDNFPYANLRMAVPSANFEATLNLLRGFAIKVNSENASGQDVSAEYADLQSRLTNLEATRDRVRAFLDDATTVEELLKINQTLSDLEGQIEQVKGQMKFYEGRAAFSTIDVTLNPQYPTPTPTATPTANSHAHPHPALEFWQYHHQCLPHRRGGVSNDHRCIDLARAGAVAVPAAGRHHHLDRDCHLTAQPQKESSSGCATPSPLLCSSACPAPVSRRPVHPLHHPQILKTDVSLPENMNQPG